MLNTFYLKDGTVCEGEVPDTTPIILLTDPTDTEVQEVSGKYGISPSRILAVSDLDEPSSFDYDDRFAYSILDVPYHQEERHYDTVPVSTILGQNVSVIVCKRKIPTLFDFFVHCKYENITDTHVLQLYMCQMIIKEYQNDLRMMNRQLMMVKAMVRTHTNEDDLFQLDEIGNSLVAYMMSLRSIRTILDKVSSLPILDSSPQAKQVMKSLVNDNNQAIEMAMTYQSVCDNAENLVNTSINLHLNKSMRFLALITIVLTIPMIITGFYGMNVDLPMAHTATAYFLIILICSLIALALAWFFRWGIRR